MTTGKRGPKPAPTVLKEMKGERPSRMSKNEPRPKPSLKVPKAPEWVSFGARQVWNRLAPELHEKGVLTSWDLDAFAAYCEAVIHHRDACKQVDEEGIVVQGDRGMVKNPALQLVRDNAQLLRGFAQEFGLTPSARSGIELPTSEESDSARRLLS